MKWLEITWYVMTWHDANWNYMKHHNLAWNDMTWMTQMTWMSWMIWMTWYDLTTCNGIHFFLELAPRVFFKLTELKLLDLSNNPIQFIDGATFVDIPDLEIFKCNHCELFQVGSIPKYLIFKLFTKELILLFTVAGSWPNYTNETSYSASGLQWNPRFGRNPSQHFTTFAAFGSLPQSNSRNFVPQTFEQKQTFANFGLELQQHHFRGRVCLL